MMFNAFLMLFDYLIDLDETWIQVMEMCKIALGICLCFVMCLKWFNVLVGWKEFPNSVRIMVDMLYS